MRDRKQPKILLLTATITPPKDAILLLRQDPADRLADYLDTLAFYLDEVGSTFDGIVFAENSASDLRPIMDLVDEKMCGDRVELISFFGLDYPASYGRAYGEWGILEEAIQKSRFSIGVGSEDVFWWKITGRYKIRNLSQIMSRIRPVYDLCCHVRHYPQRWADMYLMGFNRVGFDAVLGPARDRLKNGLGTQNPEEEFERILSEAANRVRLLRRFPSPPVIDGIRGFDGTHYLSSAERLKLTTRKLASRIVPWLWV